MTWFTKLALRLRRDQDGVALVVVISIASILLVLATIAVSTALSGVVKARTDQSWNSAIAAAYAGIEDYKGKIANDSSYYRFGNPAAPFTSVSGSTVTLPTGSDTNPAFGTGVGQSWQSIRSDKTRAEYRYEVDNSKYASTGVIRIRSTGKVGDETRSVVANLRQSGFIDFLYYTNYEIMDPDVSGAPPACVKYAYDGRSSGSSNPCGDIQFTSSDTINGPMHSNDRIRICGAATFKGQVTTSYKPSSGIKYAKLSTNDSSAGCTGEVFDLGAPTWAKSMDLPPTNTAMINEVRTDIPDLVPDPGCLYTGPTKITLNSGGTMTVRSPWTKATQVVGGDPMTSGSTPTKCGIPGDSFGQLGSSGGATVPILNDNLIFVQNVPVTSSGSNPNRRSSSQYPTGYSSSVCNSGNGIGYPRSSESISNVTSKYGCRNGDVFVEGNMNGKMTITAENYIYVTGDIKYSNSENDVLGLISNSMVWVWNPVNSSGNALLSDNRRIDAAILSVAHSFQVQNYDTGGTQGTLTVNGAIAQKFRGPVGTSSGGAPNSGYLKNYNYDPRLKYIAPPKFLNPVTSNFGVSVLVEVKTAYNADGSNATP